MIENAQILFVSPVTAWEIAVKVSKGKPQLPLSPRIYAPFDVRVVIAVHDSTKRLGLCRTPNTGDIGPRK